MYACVPEQPAELVAVTVKLELPEVVGLPVIAPVVELRAKPAGNAPPLTE